MKMMLWVNEWIDFFSNNHCNWLKEWTVTIDCHNHEPLSYSYLVIQYISRIRSLSETNKDLFILWYNCINNNACICVIG